MKTLRYCTIVILLTTISISAEARTWVAKTGQTIDGEFVKLEDETVSIQLSDGKLAKIKLDLLSDDDQKFVKNSMKNADNPFQIEDSPFEIVTTPLAEKSNTPQYGSQRRLEYTLP